jgi:hypothetical protein
VLIFVTVFVLLIAPVVHATDNQACSNASVQGTYEFSASGTIVGVGPTAGVGLFTSDGKGNISGKDTSSFNGAIVRETFTATYTVNADCSGSATAVFQGPVPRTIHVDFVVVDNGKQVFNILTDSGDIVTFTDEKIFPGED